MLKHFTFVFHEIDPHLPCVVINETHVVLASSNGFCLRGPHIWVDHFQRFGTYMSCLNWDGCLVCFPNWHASQTSDITSFIPNLGRPPIRFCFSINLKRWKLTWPIHLCQIPMFPAPFPCVNNMKFTLGMFTSKVNIRPFLSPFVINSPWFFMSSTKHPFGLNFTRKPCFTIWPTETIFFVMVRTWRSFKYFVCPSCMDNGTLPIYVMECVMSSLVSTNLSVFKSFVFKPFSMTSHVIWSSRIHIPYIVIWYTSYHWICHVLHRKQLFITLIASWCTIPLLQLFILCVMFPFIIILCFMPMFPEVVVVWVAIWLLTLMTSTTTSTTSSSFKVSSSTSMRLTFMLMMSTMRAFVSTSKWGFSTSTSISIKIWVESTFLWSSIGWSTNNSHLFTYK